MKFLITGGAGFIGSNFCDYVVNKYKDDSFVCLDALTYAGNEVNIEHLLIKDNFRFIKGNICDVAFIDSLFNEEKFDIVINFAAESHVDRSFLNTQLFFNTNVIGVSILLDACNKYKIKRFHQVSTDEVYGDIDYDDTITKFKEEDILKPNNPYSASKASADLLTLSYFKSYRLPISISRSSNNYGIRQFPEKLVPVIIKKIIKGETVPIYGKGNNVRDWLDVRDCCCAIDLIVRKGKEGEVYNISAHNYKTNLEMVNFILGYLNKSEDLIVYVDDRMYNDKKYVLDSEKIEKELCWEPKYGFEEGLKDTIDWYLNNIDWLEVVEKEGNNDDKIH